MPISSIILAAGLNLSYTSRPSLAAISANLAFFVDDVRRIEALKLYVRHTISSGFLVLDEVLQELAVRGADELHAEL